MKNSTRQALPIVASVIGQRLGIPVVVGGNQAMTNGKMIVIPNVESEEHKGVAFGYLIHEGAHIRYTDFAQVGSTPYTRSLANIFEDIRIEQAIAREYPGAPDRIREVIDHLVEKGGMPVSSGKPHEILHQHVLLRLRSRILKQERLNDLAREQEKILRERLPEGVVVRLHGILASAEKNGSTADCVAMAERIVAMLKEEAEKEQQRKKDEEAAQPPNDPPQADSPDVTDEDSGDESDETAPEQTEESDEDESEGEADADDDGDEDSPGDAGGPGDDASEENADTDAPTSQSRPSSDDANDGEENGDASQDGSSPDQTEESDEDESEGDEPQWESHTPDDSGDEGEEGADDNTSAPPQTPGSGASNDPRSDESMEAVEAILNNQEEAPQDLFQQVAAILETVGAGRAFSLPLEHKAEASVDTALLQKAGSESARIAAALDGLVQSERQERRTHKHQGRKLDTGKLHRTISGDTKVFLREQRREAVNTALHVLLDLSGSMTGIREPIAKEAAMALALALDRIPGVNQSLTVFPGGGAVCDGTTIPSVTRLLAPREHPRRLSGPLAQCHAGGGTPMTEALYYAASRLVGGQEHRKTILVITDGEPNDPASTKKAVTEIRHMGIEICGIGIGTMVVRDLFPEHVVIGNVQELRNALFAMARRILALRAA